MKTRNLIVMIFALGWLLLIGIIPVFAQDEKKDENRHLIYGSPMGISFERFGWDWHMGKIGVIGKKRFGFGLTVIEGWKPYPYQIPKSSDLGNSIPPSNTWLIGPFNYETSSEMLETSRFFPISLYFSILTWGKDENKPIGSILLYVDDSFWNRIFRNPTDHYRDEKFPLPTLSNTEFGIRIIPFGAWLALTLFYKKVSISPGIIRMSSSWSLGNVCSSCGGNSFYYFPGYDKDFIGMGIEFMLFGGSFKDF